MKTIIGQAARGDDFLPRPNITNEIWEKLNSGSNLLLVAPRRVGKSSILFDLEENPLTGYIVIYYISESVNNINEFYKKLFNHIIEKFNSIKKHGLKLKGITKDFLSRIESINIADLSLTIGESKVSYLAELEKLFYKLNLKDEKILVLVDEFASTVENIIEDHGEREAIKFLQTKREIRQSNSTYKKIQFVYAGSIGLENIVSRFNGIKFINDLNPVLISTLTSQEIESLLHKIIDNPSITFADDALEYLLNTIEWWIPFYFQLILHETGKILSTVKTDIITKEIIDEAVKKALKLRGYFEHWFTRLRTAFKGNEFSFTKELLNRISEKQTIDSNEILDLSERYNVKDTYIDIFNSLKYDGYINNDDDPKVYRFNSPLLRKWWYYNVAN